MINILRYPTAPKMNSQTLSFIHMALAEDIGAGDVTAEYFVPAERLARAFVVARRVGVVSGVELAAEVFRVVDASLKVQVLITDGSRISAGAMLIEVTGLARSILTAERTALNFLQRLSGVASLTALYVERIYDTQAKILDTRKTTPGYRLLEKQAVLDGGGTNHRLGLYDRAMVKDNHLVAEGNTAALQGAIDRLHAEKPEIKVELEADRIEQVEAFLKLEGVSYILLDNMTLTELREAVALRGARLTPQYEASGGVTLETLRAIAETGVDFISVGALTHSAPALDIGLDFTPYDG